MQSSVCSLKVPWYPAASENKLCWYPSRAGAVHFLFAVVLSMIPYSLHSNFHCFNPFLTGNQEMCSADELCEHVFGRHAMDGYTVILISCPALVRVPRRCASAAPQWLQHPCVIGTVPSTNPKHSPTLATMKKINTTPAKASTTSHGRVTLSSQSTEFHRRKKSEGGEVIFSMQRSYPP